MRAATILAHPARWEGFGLVLLEAMAARLPVVAAAVSAIPEVVEAECTGILVPPDNPAALARALDRVLDDAALRVRLAEAGYRRLTSRFAPERMVSAHERLYDDCMQGVRRSG